MAGRHITGPHGALISDLEGLSTWTFESAALLVLLTIAWTQTAIFMTESVADDEIIVYRDLAYREGASRYWKLDLAAKKNTQGKPRPGIVVIHGGGWIEGDKSSFSTENGDVPGNIQHFAKLGFVAVTVNYRLAGEAPFPAALEDCQAAVRWLRGPCERLQPRCAARRRLWQLCGWTPCDAAGHERERSGRCERRAIPGSIECRTGSGERQRPGRSDPTTPERYAARGVQAIHGWTTGGRASWSVQESITVRANLPSTSRRCS